jgi:hypothetical protein
VSSRRPRRPRRAGAGRANRGDQVRRDGTTPDKRDERVAIEQPRRDPHAEAVIDARLGRQARDLIEATVVLEAWMGRPAESALSSARHLVNLEGPPPRALSNADPFADSDQQSVVAEGLTLVLLILSVAAWATPIRRHLGPHVLSHAIRVALPIAVALQWGLRSRYLGRPDGLACLARDGVLFWAAALALISVPLIFLSGWGPVAALLIPIWVGGTVLTRRGWGLVYAGVLVICTIALDQGLEPYAVLGSLTAITLLMCLAGIRTRARQTDARSGSVRRAVVAALIGGMIGVLLVGDPSLAWGVHGVHPAIALLPSVIGSFWGGYYLWNFYDAVPRGLRGVSLERASRVAFSDPAMSIFVGAVARLLAATVVLSAVVAALGGLTHGSDALSVFVAFGCVGTVSMLIGMLEAFSLQTPALIAAGAALATELAWNDLVHAHASGAALAVGATVGVILTLPPLMVRLIRSGRVLATTLWIH